VEVEGLPKEIREREGVAVVNGIAVQADVTETD